jgi:putative redox protein
VIGELAEGPARFLSVALNIEARGNSEELERLIAIADRGCIMMNTLRGVLDLRIRIGAAI